MNALYLPIRVQILDHTRAKEMFLKSDGVHLE